MKTEKSNQPRRPAAAAKEAAPKEITIEKWVYGGEGLSRTDDGVILTPFVLPGETVRTGKRDKMHAELAEIISPSPARVAPPCPVFTRCGGCQYQHAPYEVQLDQKVAILREQLSRVGKIKFDGQIGVISGPAFGYRNRIQLHVENGRIGYLAPRSHNLIALDGDCPVASPRLNQELAAMRDRLRDPRFPKFAKVIEIFTNETDVQVNVTESDKPVARRFYDWCESQVEISYPTSVGNFRVSPKSFFQVNRFLVDRLIEAAIGQIEGESALDLYAGVGLFSVPLSRRFKHVAAVEAGGAEAHDLAFNSKREQETRPDDPPIEVVYAKVEEYLAHTQDAPDFVLADPPRAGLGKDVVLELLRIKPKVITIVSCDPATLARDLAMLEGYRIQSLTMVDLFPQTYHMETVAQITLS